MNLSNILYIFFICLSCAQSPQPKNTMPSEALPGQTDSRDYPDPGAAQLDQYLPLLREKRVACVVNHTSIIGATHLVDTLRSHGVEIVKAFAPEHGFRGETSDGVTVGDSVDAATGMPVLSLYGRNRKPTTKALSDVDIMVFDIQDVGVRFYTYISTLQLVMEACAERGIPVLVLDRPNPNGYYVDGPVLDTAYRSFVGMQSVPVVYGMTVGEYALMLNGERWLANGAQCDLSVIPCTGYEHNMTFSLPVPPSPNLPNHRAVLLYPSLCFFEGTEVSVGRGTTMQFQVLGHPGYRQKSFRFTPVSMPGAVSPPHRGVALYGDNLTLLSVDEIASWRRLNLSWLLSYYRDLTPENDFFLPTAHFDHLAGNAALRQQVRDGLSADAIRGSWQDGCKAFMAIREKYLLYPDFVE
jgi:uncharacterized protein YbbC (DUF1343 family)